MNEDLYSRYLGVLRLLCETSVYLDDDEGPLLRESIERALTDACHYHPTLHWRRIVNRLEIESRPEGETE